MLCVLITHMSLETYGSKHRFLINFSWQFLPKKTAERIGMVRLEIRVLINCEKYSTRRSYWPIVQRPSFSSHHTHTTILYVSCRTYSLSPTPNERFFFFENLFHGKFYLSSEFLPEICWEEIAEEMCFFFNISFLVSDLRYEPEPYI